MLHTKFGCNRPIGSEKEDFEVFLPYMGHVTQGHESCDPDAANKLSFPVPRRLHVNFGFDWPSGFGEENV